MNQSSQAKHYTDFLSDILFNFYLIFISFYSLGTDTDKGLKKYPSP